MTDRSRAASTATIVTAIASAVVVAFFAVWIGIAVRIGTSDPSTSAAVDQSSTQSHSSAPAAPPTPPAQSSLPAGVVAGQAGAVVTGSASAKASLRALVLAVKDYYADPANALAIPPGSAEIDGGYTLVQGPSLGGSDDWSWPDIATSDGVRNLGVYGYSAATWCAWVYFGDDPGYEWSATPSGVRAGGCGDAA